MVVPGQLTQNPSSEDQVHFSWVYSYEWDFLGHRVYVCLALLEAMIQVSSVAMPIYPLTSKSMRIPFALLSSPMLGISSTSRVNLSLSPLLTDLKRFNQFL